MTPRPSTGIGQPVPRKEDLRLLAGAGCYTTDVSLPGQLHAVMVRSPHAHARILAIDTAAARAAPGVLAVVTGADLAAEGMPPIPNNPTPGGGGADLTLRNRDGSPLRAPPHHLLPADKARFVGVAVAMVVGETLAAATDGAELVDVHYQEMPAVAATPDALDHGAPLVWDEFPDNIGVDAGYGDEARTEAAIKSAAHVVKLTTWIQRVTAAPMEVRSAVCAYDAEKQHFTLYCGADNAVRRKRDLAALFGVADDNVRVICRDVGGNFGTRNWFYPEYGLVAWAARKLGRPVKWTAARSEGLLSDYQGRDLYAEAELALDRDGNFAALRASLVGNVGAIPVSYSPLNKSCSIIPSVYRFPAAFIRARAVTTNTAPTAPYRSSGRPEAMLIVERLIDLAARENGFDRLELRRRNLVPQSAMPYTTAVGLTYDSGDYTAAMEKALALGDWNGFPARRAEAKKRGMLRGIGFSNYIEITTGAPRERSDIFVLPEGQVDVVIGTTAAGQGHETSFTQCVSEWLGVPFDRVRLVTGDTDRVQEGGGSHSARSMRLGGIVMGEASRVVIQKGLNVAAHVLEASTADIEFDAGRYRVKGTDRSIGIFDVAREAATRTDLPDDLRGPLSGTHDFVNRTPAFPYGAQTCEVEIDPDTGRLEITRYVAVDDVGRAINPLILHGQAHGGIVTGLGQALLEHACYDSKTGQMLAGSFMDYAMPRARMFPSFVTEIMEVPTPTNPLGVRGGGEGGTTPALAVMVNAIIDALSDYGVRHIELPATPQRIWQAIQAAPAKRVG